MARPKKDAPSPSWSKAWKQRVVRISGEDIPLGNEGGATLAARRDAALAEWYQRGRQPRGLSKRVELSLDELILRRVEHVIAKYAADGRDSKAELNAMRQAFRLLRQRHGGEVASAFDVEKLDRLRDALSSQTVTRRGRSVTMTKRTVDGRVAYIKRLFKWAAHKRFVPVEVYSDITTLPILNRYETQARVNPPVEAVDDALVNVIIPFLTPTGRDMLRVQYLTGMRPAEMCQMTGAMIDRTSNPWRYTPARRKTARHGWNPAIHLSAECQEILQPYIDRTTSADQPLFSPRRVNDERDALKRAKRKTRVQPSQVSRRKVAPRRAASDDYSSDSYRRMLRYAMKQAINAGVMREDQVCHPHQIRHNAAKFFARAEGALAAQTLLGHKDHRTTMRYVGYDEKMAAALADSLGKIRGATIFSEAPTSGTISETM